MSSPAAGENDLTARIDADARSSVPRSGDDAQFAPGTEIAGRYRIASILGKGGMGEVYRAEDVRLGQTVALKFLPARLAKDAHLRARLHDEVRHGRVIAHPNVCRIYDIVEWEDAVFVSMEFVDGEDLSRLLKRIGRVPADKAVEISRGIAAGLMAAHGKNVLHRDLKPANVMLDSRGEARIMDFGLALPAGQDDGTISGTVAYLAPEVAGGATPTVQSDLYALGLVMYELFTGTRVHQARTLPERLRETASAPSLPSAMVPDVDPAVERVILRCLSDDPARRPRSAREVLQSLPGVDPLAAAMAAGETPSPRTVAAAGAAGTVSRGTGWTMLAAVALLLAFVVAGKRLSSLTTILPVTKSPEVMAEQTGEMLQRLGIPRLPFRSWELEMQQQYVGWLLQTRQSGPRWERLKKGPSALVFSLRESARPPDVAGQVPDGSAETRATVDTRGRLVALTVRNPDAARRSEHSWNELLRLAGFDPASLTPVAASSVLPVPADVRAAWKGVHPDDGTLLHIEAAAWRGLPVYFEIGGAWKSVSPAVFPFDQSRLAVFGTTLVVAVMAVAILLAWRNARLRRGDRQGAFRIAVAILFLELAAAMIGARHYRALIREVELLQRATADALLWAVLSYILYLALEPFIRRRWPGQLIASTRLIAGDLRDPMVGRDVLIGIMAGLAHCALIMAGAWLDGRSENAAVPPFAGRLSVLEGGWRGVGHVFESISTGVVQGFMTILVLVAAMMLFRRRFLAALALVAVFLIGFYAATGGVAAVPLAITAVLVYTAARYGLLAIAVAQIAFHTIFHYPLFRDGTWGSMSFLPIAILGASAVWAFVVALGDQKAVPAHLLDG